MGHGRRLYSAFVQSRRIQNLLDKSEKYFSSKAHTLSVASSHVCMPDMRLVSAMTRKNKVPQVAFYETRTAALGFAVV
jgi:hypothetical protein